MSSPLGDVPEVPITPATSNSRLLLPRLNNLLSSTRLIYATSDEQPRSKFALAGQSCTRRRASQRRNEVAGRAREVGRQGKWLITRTSAKRGRPVPWVPSKEGLRTRGSFSTHTYPQTVCQNSMDASKPVSLASPGMGILTE